MKTTASAWVKPGIHDFPPTADKGLNVLQDARKKKKTKNDFYYYWEQMSF